MGSGSVEPGLVLPGSVISGTIHDPLGSKFGRSAMSAALEPALSPVDAVNIRPAT